MSLQLSIIVPTLDKAGFIAATLDALATLRERGHEGTVVDGGSRDAKLALCRERADAAFTSTRGRSCCSGIATGDQAMFVRRTRFEQEGGHADLPLLEAVDLSRRQRGPALISGRRWEARGVWRTVWLMWRLRWRHWRGGPDDQMAKVYR